MSPGRAGERGIRCRPTLERCDGRETVIAELALLPRVAGGLSAARASGAWATWARSRARDRRRRRRGGQGSGCPSRPRWWSRPAARSTSPPRSSGAASGQSTAVTWTVQEGAAGGTIDAERQVQRAPPTEGNYHVVATSVATPRRARRRRWPSLALDRAQPRPADAVEPRGGRRHPHPDDGVPDGRTSPGRPRCHRTIQAAIDACPAGQVVQLSAGHLHHQRRQLPAHQQGHHPARRRPGQTTLQKTDGAKPGRRPPEPTPRRWSSSARPATRRRIEPARPTSPPMRSRAPLRHRGQRRRLQRRPVRPPRRALRRRLADRPRRARDRSGPRPTSAWSGSGTTRRQGTDDPFPDAARLVQPRRTAPPTRSSRSTT